MAEVPKIVRARLAAKSDPGMHLDADLLTAFAEQSLSWRERDRVLAHLSQCAECREVAILATPQTPAILPQPAPSSQWLSWPALRWGTLAACGVIVIGAVSLYRRSDHLAGYVDRKDSIVVALQQNEAAPAAKAPPASSTATDRDALDSKSRAGVARREEPVSQAPKPVDKGFYAARAKNAPMPSAPPAEEKRQVFSSAAQLANKPADKVASVAALDAAPAPVARDTVSITAQAQPLQSEAAQANLGKAKDASELNSNAFAKASLAKQQAMAAAAPAAVNQYPYKKLTPRWTLSADGTLQRSLDAGKTWKTIPVSADATFTAVAAMDSDIWVGGTHGALYHSVDAGEHWAQVVPLSGGQPLTSNIIGIEFTDALHGKISTSSQESWTTSDGGQNWQVAR